MTASVVNRAWGWRSFMWAGVIASVVAWAWVWFRQGGASALMLLVALAAVVFAYRGAAGVRVALVGAMVAGLAMLLASLYWMALLLVNAGSGVSAFDVITTSVLPMVAAVVLLLGATTGLRHARAAAPSAKTASS